MSAFLEQILAATGRRVAESKRHSSARELARLADKHRPRGFHAALARATAGVAVIAELKKASPSRGMLRGTFPVGRLASQLAAAGAAALSVLTEEKFFHGSLANLRETSAASDLPCLRKDFIIDEYQLLESRAHRADAVLLILAALDDAQLARLLARSRELGLDALCEVHDEQEVERARRLGCQLIGVNSRDLHSFRVDQETAMRLAPQLPGNALRVAESGIAGPADVRRLRAAGYQAFLVGEWLMKAEDPGASLTQLLAESKAPPLGAAGVAAWKLGTKD